VSTTRPETILGDVAVAINPNDVRYKGLNGVQLWHPFRKCTIPIIYDHSVDKDFGTGNFFLNHDFSFLIYFKFYLIKGAVKLTPAHDIFDYELAIKHDLPIVNVIDEYGKISCEHEEFNVNYIYCIIDSRYGL